MLEGVNSANANEAPEAISADGTQLIMFRDGELCMAQKGVNGWNPPQKLPENINFANWQADAMISSDGQAILFAASQKTPYQLHNPDNSVYDNSNIFVSVKDSAGNWGKAIDLGWAINTPFSDRSPMLHPDMKTLYFCSAGHGSMGGTDVFMTRRLRDDSWTEWSEPVSLGKEINSVENECWYKITTEGTKAYFSLQDIFCMDIPESMRPNPVATISGRLIGANGQPIAASIKWEDLELGEVIGECKSDPADGRFFIVLPMGRNYGYFVDDNDLFPISDNLDLRDKNENVVINRDFSVWSLSQMIASGTPMPMNNLFFDVADATLLESSISELTRVLHLIKRIGGKIEISGHTDDTGNATSNQKLSEARAMSARNFLVNAGYDPNLIKVVGYGESRPVDTNKTAEGRQRNRRVEIKFLK